MQKLKCLFLIFCLSCSQANYKDPEKLILAIESFPKTLDPRYATDANGQRLTALLFQSLVRFSDQLEIEGEAAASWTLKDNTYTFTIPRGKIFFSNGAPLTKEDLEFTFSEYQRPDSPFKNILSIIQKLEVTESQEYFLLNISLKEPSATFLADLIPIKILPKNEVTKWQKDFFLHLVGSHYFQLQKRDVNLYVFSPNPYYIDNPVKFKEVHFKVIQDDSTRYLKMKKGEIDIAQNVISPIRVKDFLKNEKDFKVFMQDGLSMNYILINFKDPLLKDLEVRKSLAEALNLKQIIDFKLEGLATPATSLISSSLPLFNRDLQPTPYAPESAKARISKMNSKPKLTIKSSNAIEVVEVAKVISHSLKQIGIETEVQSFEWGTFYSDVSQGNFQLALMRWVGATDPDLYRMALHSSEVPPGRNRGSYINPKLDELVESGKKEMNPEKRKEIYNQVQKIVFEDFAYIPLWYLKQVSVINNRVENYYFRANSDYLGIIKAHKNVSSP